MLSGYFLSIKFSRYLVGLSTKCVVQLFLSNGSKVKKWCQKSVQPRVILPIAKYRTEGIWVLSTQRKVGFSVTCHAVNGISTTPITAKAPFDVVKLPPSGSAKGGFLYLNAFYNRGSVHRITDEILHLLRSRLNISSTKIWKDFDDKIPQFKHQEIHEKLGVMEKILMASFVNEINSIREIGRHVPIHETNIFSLVFGLGISHIASIWLFIF